jgi:hypothetical protein
MITEIEFKRTSNIFINAGIVALYQYLKNCREDGVFDYEYSFSLDKDSLHVKCDNLFILLEDIYYYMGKELYDTSGKNARQSADKFYFREEPFSYDAFFKMKTYGLGALITNDPQPSSKEPDNAVTFEKLVQKNPVFATNVGKVFYERKMKLKDYEPTETGYQFSKNTKGDSKIFLNEPYIKITRLEKPKRDYFEPGNQVCYLTNESYKKLVDSQNTSPFIKGLKNFNSLLSAQSQNVSWKAMYVSRFSPKLNLYTYVSGLDSIVCYFFDSNNLFNLNTLYEQNRSMFKDSIQMIESNYMSNFKTHSFFNKDEKLTEPKDYTGKNETLFALIYTLYKQFLYEKGFEDISEVDNIFDLGFDKIPISLISFKADSFSSTLRPNAFEYFNNFKFAIRLIIYLEKEGIKFSQLLSSLKFLKSSERNSKKSYQLERKLREEVITLMLNGKSILKDLTQLYYQCYTYLLKGDSVGFKNYEQLYLFTSKYELKINKKMTQEMQEKAFKLGTSIGMAIVNFDNPKNENDKKTNAKNGRKYIIDLNKSRTLTHFNDAIIRIQNKYQIIVSGELFRENLNDENFELVKQFAIIGALNKINEAIKPYKPNTDEK